MSNPALLIAETIQTGHINHRPSPAHDINPSTAASKKQPVTTKAPSLDSEGISDDESEDEEIPYSALRPLPRKSTLPPLPDLRFEQSYLASISGADTWYRVAWITTRDQVMLPLAQGTLWTLALLGWRYWNMNASFSGKTVGSRIRRWWWGVNNWAIPDATHGTKHGGKGQRRKFSPNDAEVAKEVTDVS
ncbi:MAG: hypothetical protein M1832_005839 [Thelocarpon impressellum]|nr:MAG: hypothetical protein M1832_005839 [Thelocarpon impressellum]